MENNHMFYITINRIWCHNFNHQTKVRILIIDGQQVLMKSSAKSLKNGTAYFYRQSFQVPSSPNLKFELQDFGNNQILATLPLSSQLKQPMTGRKNVYETISEYCKLIWEVQIDNGFTDKKGQLTERELFDSHDEFVPLGGTLSFYQPAKKIREKRLLSTKTKDNSDAVSEPSESFQKLLELNNFHKKVSMNIQTIQKCKSTIHKKQNLEPQKLQIKQQKKKDGKANQKALKLQQSSRTNLTFRKSYHFQSPIKQLNVNRIQKSPQNHLKRCRSNFLARLGMREMISSAVLGIVSGLAATQF